MAGKLSFAATAARSRVGRAYLKQIYRQSRVPCGNLTWWTLMALQWWSGWLRICGTQRSNVCRVKTTFHTYTVRQEWTGGLHHLDGTKRMASSTGYGRGSKRPVVYGICFQEERLVHWGPIIAGCLLGGRDVQGFHRGQHLDHWCDNHGVVFSVLVVTKLFMQICPWHSCGCGWPSMISTLR